MKILVAGISVRAMVESAVRSQYPVVALDAFGDQDLRLLAESCSLHHDFNARYSPQALEKASRALSYDAVAYTSDLENHPDVLQQIAGGRQIIGNSPQSIRSVRSWGGLFAKLRQAGFPVPDTYVDEQTWTADPLRRWLVKPVWSGGGHGVHFSRSLKWPGRPYMLQEYLPGKACSASFLANGRDCIVLGLTEQLIGLEQFGSQGFRYCGNILPLPESLHNAKGRIILEQTRRLAAFLTREYGLTGINGIDFILSGDRIYLTEVNPRYSASMELIEQAYELPIFRLHARAVVDDGLPEFRLEEKLTKTGFWGKAILYAVKDAIAPDTHKWIGKTIRDIPVPGERLRAGNPICTVLANQSTYEETLTDLVCRAASLKEEIHG